MNIINKFPQFITTQRGMRRNLLAAFLGGLAALAFPPVYMFPLAIVGFSGFLIMIVAAESRKAAFKLGWWFGFGHFTAGLYWISFALLVDESFWWLFPIAMLGIPAVVAFYIALVAIITWQVKRYIRGWSLVVVFSCIWVLVEMLRGWLFTGFPWNLSGYIFTISGNILQFASVGGIWGLSLVAMLVVTMPAVVVGGQWLVVSKKWVNVSKWVPISFSVLLIAGIYIWGGKRLAAEETQFVPGIKLRIVQGNIPQNLKWEDEWRYASVKKYIEMSTSEGFDEITHVIWPETALPFTVSEDSPLLAEIARAAPKNGAVITGALHAIYSDAGFIDKIFNSLMVVTPEGKIYSRYDKSHLVPFGEYVPLRGILPLEKITNGQVDFTPGGGLKTINAPKFPAFGGLVCYEVIFPGKVIDENNPPNVLINVTNDAWYGNTSGPYQHFQMARVRAIEEGVPLVRSANNGISAVIDGYGRVINRTKLSETVVMDSYLPTKINNKTTYSMFRNGCFKLLMVVLLIIACKNIIFRNDYS